MPNNRAGAPQTWHVRVTAHLPFDREPAAFTDLLDMALQ